MFATYPSLESKSVFITGGATGIGAAMVKAFSRQKSNVYFVDINKEKGNEIERTLREEGLQTTFKYCDITETPALEASILDAASIYGEISVLINNAADDSRYDIEELNSQTWQHSLDVNLTPAFFASKVVSPMMEKIGGGSIINFSTINVLFGPKKMAGYITAKSGILGLTKAMAHELGEYSIRVNAVLPGWVATERQLKDWLTPEAEKEWQESVCIKERIDPKDVAQLALFLAADDSSKITSQQFIIDCGRV